MMVTVVLSRALTKSQSMYIYEALGRAKYSDINQNASLSSIRPTPIQILDPTSPLLQVVPRKLSSDQIQRTTTMINLEHV